SALHARIAVGDLGRAYDAGSGCVPARDDAQGAARDVRGTPQVGNLSDWSRHSEDAVNRPEVGYEAGGTGTVLRRLSAAPWTRARIASGSGQVAEQARHTRNLVPVDRLVRFRRSERAWA